MRPLRPEWDPNVPWIKGPGARHSALDELDKACSEILK